MHAESSEQIKVLIVDDMEQVRRSLRTILQLCDDIEVVGEACNGVEAIRTVESCRPDVVLMDFEMPVLNGLDATQKIKALHPDIGIVIVTIHDDPGVRKSAAKAGVNAFVGKETETEVLLEIIRDLKK